MPPAPRRFVDDYLSYLLGRASHAVYRDFGQQVRAAGLASLEWRVLATLSGEDAPSTGAAPLPGAAGNTAASLTAAGMTAAGMTIGELARDVLAKQPTLTKLIQRMAEAGWVRLGADELDARRTLVYATPKGRRVVARLIDAARAHEASLLAGVSTAQVRQLKALLRRLIQGGAPAQPASSLPKAHRTAAPKTAVDAVRAAPRKPR